MTTNGETPLVPIVYAVSRWTNANRAAARHIDDGNGRPLCGGNGRKAFSWVQEEGEPTCAKCIAAHSPIKAKMMLDGWAGRYIVPVEIIGETDKRYRVRLMEETKLPARRIGKIGEVILVPRYSVKLAETV